MINMKIKKEGWEEGRVENAQFAVKDLSLGRTLWLIDWFIEWLIDMLQDSMFMCVWKVLTALVNEEVSSNCPSQYTSMTCNKRETLLSDVTSERISPITARPHRSLNCLLINQSIVMFCPRAGRSLQTQHSPLCPLLSLPSRIFIQSIYHNVVYHLTSFSASNFLPAYHSV